MAETYECAECEGPWFNRDDNPTVWDTLNRLPIGFCDCLVPDFKPVEYELGERAEVYYLATAPATNTNKQVCILLDEQDLEQLGWIHVQDEQFYLTKRGKKLLPLLLLVASDLINSCGTNGA